MRLLLAALGAALLIAAPAQGSVLLTNCAGRWCHQHTRTYTYAFEANVPNWFRTYVRNAASEWDRLTVLTSYEVPLGNENVTIKNGNVRGVCPPNAVACAHVPYHERGWEMYGVPPSEPPLPSQKKAAKHVACHEEGHSWGLAHGGLGCLRTEPKPIVQHELDWIAGVPEHPGSDDVALINRQYPATGH